MLALVVLSAHAEKMDLKQAIDYALTHHIDLKLKDADREVRWHQLTVLQEKFSPQILLSMSGTIHHEEYFNEEFHEQKLHAYPTLRLQTPIGTVIELFTDQNIGYEQGQRKSGAALHVQIEQPLLQGRNKTVNTWSIENAKLLDDIEELARQKTIENIIYHVIVTYHTLLIQSKKIELQRRWLNQTEQFYDSMNSKWEADRAAKSDVSFAELNVKQAKIQLNQTQAEYRQALRLFCQAIGYDGEEITLKQDDYRLSFFPLSNKDKWINTAIENDVETKILAINQERLTKELIVAKDSQLFDLKLRGNVTLGRYHIFGNQLENDVSDDYIYSYPFVHQNGNYSAELQLNIPITGKQGRYHQELSIRMAMLKMELEQMNHRRKLDNNITYLLESTELSDSQRELSKDTLEMAQRNYQNALLKYEAGRTSLFEVDMMRDKWRDAQNHFLAQEILFYNNLANLELHSGLLGKKWLNS